MSTEKQRDDVQEGTKPTLDTPRGLLESLSNEIAALLTKSGTSHCARLRLPAMRWRGSSRSTMRRTVSRNSGAAVALTSASETA